ncbi:MAG: helix-hairpin-helix domain-containing protein [Campylobacterota bacterium]|nr:helix-hairpin-helix domain-containing protein [Campylobacterota bacterium]
MKIVFVTLAFVISLFASVDINSASAKELSSLHGIGDKKAIAIIEYREGVKCFKSIDELSNIKGIGKTIISKNRDILKASPCK